MDTRTWRSLTATSALRIASIESRDAERAYQRSGSEADTAGVEAMLVSVFTDGRRDYYRVDLGSGEMTKLARPSIHAELSAYQPETDTGVFVAREHEGTFLTLQRRGRQRRVIEMNTFLRDVAEGQLKIIDYTSLDGERLKGLLILPVDYQPGRRYPMVTWVYAGKVFRNETDGENVDVNGWTTNLNLQLFASHGYVVLLPSMPLKSDQGAINDDVLLRITNGVLPAVDKAIELGIADAERVAVAGHSFGGYSTYALITQTTRFKAAIAISGITDFIAAHGLFPAAQRYEDNPHEKLSMRNIMESGAARRDVPWWNDYGHYLRNSPIFYVDRVQTPLLILHGDMDFVDISGAEQFFSALLRQGRRARFVRYAGENHAFVSPANMRDLWAQMYAWLDTFVKTTSGAETMLQP